MRASWARRESPASGTPDPLASAIVSQDLELVRRVRLGDERAFEQIFRTYYARLVSFARTGIDSHDLAEETVQEVFLHIWMRRESWVVERSLAAYMFRAVRNRISNARRSLRLETSYNADIARETDGGLDEPGDGRLREAEIEAALAKALALLPDRARQVFLLSRRQHLTYAEIAEVIGISIKTVEMHMARALSQLRLALGEWRQP
ncbi:MAG TPA: RNA polymerase sigma-70 factor [Gemmatimonadaceae bacterium]|nr:RNA polymerase sigma-70 factor [Gemmatimonadaceae bacterium]